MTACPYEPRDESRPCQGALYRDVETSIVSGVEPDSDHVVWSAWTFPYSVAMSQECDLVQDYGNRQALEEAEADHAKQSEKTNHDKILLTVLMCPAYRMMAFRAGTHLADLGWTMEGCNNRGWRLIQQNKNPRYHFLASWTPLQVPELVVDFKHLFAMPMELLQHDYGTERHYIARLGGLYREDLSQRFAAYLARIGLPIPHHKVAPPVPASTD